ncbi:MAG TPA: metal ABC transporter permease [Thermoleophilaceae bacterium]|nr:metal ABC transporter permease [Thermoleophilaceae bacterium]
MDLLEPLQSGIERRALLEVVLLGGFCGALGCWITTFRLSYAAESLAHGLLPGLVLATLAGLPLLLGSLAGVAVAALVVAVAGRDPRIGSDTATAVAVTGMLGLGGLLALRPDAPARLEELLFGDPLGVTDGDLIAAAGLALVGAGALIALHRPLAAVALDADGARALGVRPTAVRIALLGLLAAALAVAVQGLGSLLVLAVLVAPAVAVRRHVASPGRATVAAGATAALAGVVGIYASHALGIAAGASVALTLCAAAAIGAGLPVALRAPGEGGDAIPPDGHVAAAGESGGPLRSRVSQ